MIVLVAFPVVWYVLPDGRALLLHMLFKSHSGKDFGSCSMPLLLQPFSGKYSALVEDPNVNIGSKYK